MSSIEQDHALLLASDEHWRGAVNPWPQQVSLSESVKDYSDPNNATNGAIIPRIYRELHENYSVAAVQEGEPLPLLPKEQSYLLKVVSERLEERKRKKIIKFLPRFDDCDTFTEKSRQMDRLDGLYNGDGAKRLVELEGAQFIVGKDMYYLRTTVRGQQLCGLPSNALAGRGARLEWFTPAIVGTVYADKNQRHLSRIAAAQILRPLRGNAP